jgi:(p)ppGpp synthase/HD superfamily hydrolase
VEILNNSPIHRYDIGMSEKFELAIKTAADYHGGQMRKGTSISYIFHPMETGMILAQNDCTETLVIAGILHDTLEDTKLTEEEIRNLFGRDVLSLYWAPQSPIKICRGLHGNSESSILLII